MSGDEGAQGRTTAGVAGSAGWNFTTRVRPPMLPGPSGVHASSTPVALLVPPSDLTREPDSHNRDGG